MLALIVMRAQPARADEPRGDAQALFESGRALMVQGNFSEACAALEQSEALDAGIGTLFNLARCYDLWGHGTSAYAAYQRVIAQMHAAGQTSREAIARDLLAALEARLGWVTLRVPPDTLVPELELRLDGAPVERADWGTAIPLDPGTHVVAASARASKPWSREFAIDHDAKSVSIDVPPLTPVAVMTPTSALPPALAPEMPSGRGRTQRVLAVAFGALGIGGVGVGSYYGLRASSLKSQASPLCDVNGCYPDGNSLLTRAHGAASTSTASFAIGGVLLVTGVVLWLTAPADSPNH